MCKNFTCYDITLSPVVFNHHLGDHVNPNLIALLYLQEPGLQTIFQLFNVSRNIKKRSISMYIYKVIPDNLDHSDSAFVLMTGLWNSVP